MSWNRLVRWVALAGCSTLIGALSFTPGASAHIGASHAPFTTDAPDLRTATVFSGPGPADVRVCFDEEVDSLDQDDFLARGYDSNISADKDDFGEVDITNTSCVLVETGHPNITEATVLVVESGEVLDPFGNANVESAVTLGGSTFNVREAPVPGNTDAPEHISTTPLPQSDQIEYGMDEELDEDGVCNADRFGYHEQDGDIVTGASCDDVSGSVVTIGFGTDIQSGNVVRPYVETDNASCLLDRAVLDLGTSETGGDNTGAKYVTASGGLGNNTNDPDLMSVARQGNNQLNFTFDTANITSPDLSWNCFWAHSEDGSIYVAESVSRSGAVVTATFPTVANAFQQIVRAGVSPGAVDQVGGDTNTFGSAPLSASGSEASASEIPASQKPGYSDGPDLEQAVTNDANNTINYCHDEPLDTVPSDVIPGSFFFTTSDSSDVNSGTTVLSISGACILIQFGGADDVSTAVVAGEEDNLFAVGDRLGECTFTNEVGGGIICDFLDPGGSDDQGANLNILGASVAVNGPPPSSLAAPPAPPGPPGPPAPPAPPGADCPPPYAKKAGNSADNKLKGTSTCDKLLGKGGDDVLRGKGEDDLLKGGAGDDVLKGGPGNDKCRGGPGKDTKISC